MSDVFDLEACRQWQDFPLPADRDNLQAANGRFLRSLDSTAIEVARLKLRIMELEEREGFNTMKVRRQEKAIQALEKKLRKAGVRPYAADEVDA